VQEETQDYAALNPRGSEKENQIRMESESRDLLTVEQAAAYLQLSQSSIRSYIRQGKLNAFRIAGKRKVLIPRTELLKLLEPARAQDVDLELASGSDDEA
jgi:excisionase family DNA binding protein